MANFEQDPTHLFLTVFSTIDSAVAYVADGLWVADFAGVVGTCDIRRG